MKPIPKTIFIDNESLTDRLNIILGELVELEEATLNNTNIAEEAADIITATYQVFHKLGYNENQVNEIFEKIHNKNAKRGYYVNNNSYIKTNESIKINEKVEEHYKNVKHPYK